MPWRIAYPALRPLLCGFRSRACFLANRCDATFGYLLKALLSVRLSVKPLHVTDVHGCERSELYVGRGDQATYICLSVKRVYCDKITSARIMRFY